MPQRPKLIEKAPVQPGTESLLDRKIYEAVLQYIITPEKPSDFLDTEKTEVIDEGLMSGEDAFLCIVLLCDARAQFPSKQTVGNNRKLQWVAIARGFFATADDNVSGQRKLNRSFFSDNPANKPYQEAYFDEAISRLIDPLTMLPADTNGYNNIEIATKIAQGAFQLEYHPTSSSRSDAFPEWPW